MATPAGPAGGGIGEWRRWRRLLPAAWRVALGALGAGPGLRSTGPQRLAPRPVRSDWHSPSPACRPAADAYFTEPPSKPASKWRWKAKNTINGTAIDTNEAGAMTPMLLLN